MSQRIVYFQFQKELDFPVFIKVIGSELVDRVASFLDDRGFNKLSDDEYKKLQKSSLKLTRILEMKEASSIVYRQLKTIADSDKYGEESIVPASGYSVYRYKGIGLMVYSLSSPMWKLGVTKDFGSDSHKDESAIIIARFLGISLSTFGILGVWGTPVEEGFVLLKRSDACGEAIYIDLVNMRLISLDGVKDIANGLQIICLKKLSSNRICSMKREELISSIFGQITYLDFNGPAQIIRQMINRLSNIATGEIHHKETFRPRLKDINL